MPNKIVILIGGHLCTAPRAQKEAEFLAAHQFEVTVAGIWLDKEFANWDQELIKDSSYNYQPVLDLRNKQSVSSLVVRLKRRLALELKRILNIDSSALLGYGLNNLFKFILKEKPDLTIAHSEGGLAIIKKLHQKGFLIAADFEDWFSEDLPETNRNFRGIKLLKSLEGYALKNSLFTTTTSKALSAELAKSYAAPNPLVVYNSFRTTNYPHTSNSEITTIRIIWISQTTGSGRGLEEFLHALAAFEDKLEITIIGRCSNEYQDALIAIAPEHHRDSILFKGMLAPWELNTELSKHDIGLALETSDIKNKNLTISNKLFHYYANGLAVLATNTIGQTEVWSESKPPGVLALSFNQQAISKALTEMISANNLAHYKQASYELGKKYADSFKSASSIVNKIREL